jgi:flagellin
MSSILTNTGAMVALQTMRGINSNLQQTQNEISTGKSVSNARDNAAVWAISRTMESDVKGFEGIADSLALGKSTVSVGRQAAETVTDLLTQMKGQIVAAQESNVDREKIQTEVQALQAQIESVVGAAQFNGLNLVDGTSDSPINVLSSLNRSADGTVQDEPISVNAQNLTQEASVVDVDDGDYEAGVGPLEATFNLAANPAELTVAPPTAGVAYSLRLAGAQIDNAGGAADAGDIAYVAAEGDTAEDVAQGLLSAYDAWVAAGNDVDELSVTVDGAVITIATGEDLVAVDEVTVAIDTVTSENNRAAGGLFAMAGIDVSTQEGAETALEEIEGLIQTSISAAASFGSAERRIETQANFVSQLTDALNTGIGSLVDADMEAASARLQALQVQQQLATQSLSIANQQPQNILALFR